MATIWKRGPSQFCARVRRNGVARARTFESIKAAQDWGREFEGRATGEPSLDMRAANETSLAAALDWYESAVAPETSRSAKVKRVLIAYWRKSKFADWALSAIQPWDLLEWRKSVLDEAGARPGQLTGPDAVFGPQSCIHRLKLLSHLYGRWSLVHRSPLTSPVVPGVRPKAVDGRERRLSTDTDKRGRNEEERLFAACESANSRWLLPAVKIALETCMRQAELAELTCSRTRVSKQEAPKPRCLPSVSYVRVRGQLVDP